MTGAATGRRPARPVTPAGILAERLAGLADRDLPAPLRAELAELAALAGGLETYAEQHTSAESAALAALAAATRQHEWAATGRAELGLEQEMLSGHVEGQALKLLVAATRARQVLEIGMFTGYAALAMAEAVPSDGRVVTCEIDAEVAAFARGHLAASPAGARIDIRVAPAADTLRALAAEGASFDLIFLDADKAGYVGYVDLVLREHLLAPHGLLCVDNTLLQGQPWTPRPTSNGQAIAGFNEWLSRDPRVEQVVVALRDGLTLARWASP